MQKIYVMDLGNYDSELQEINEVLKKGGKVVSVTAVPHGDYYGYAVIVVEI